MLFLTTLLPLITLALRVAAADVEQGIPLVSHPANAYLPSRPQTHEALEANSIIPVHYGSNAQQSEPPPCLPEMNQQVLAYMRQLMPHATNLQMFVGRLEEAKAKWKEYAELAMLTCFVTGIAGGFFVLIAYTESECHRKDGAIHCGRWRRNELGDGLKIGECKPLPSEINACSNPSTVTHLSPVASKAPGGHGGWLTEKEVPGGASDRGEEDEGWCT
ncbi:hypothetical protein F5051DRAFT_442268 [Lentinula edodes]|nr:hypothetical protein F5051DRAFT_442268 [Lentinula edodes]